MAISLAYGVLPYNTLFDINKVPLSKGIVTFYDNTTRLKKNVFQDPAGQIPYDNPLTLDKAGRVPPLYFMTDSAYFITVQSMFRADVWTLTAFVPGADGGITPVTLINSFDNLMINGQFRFFKSAFISPVPKITSILLADDAHYFIEDGVNSNDAITFGKFDLDDTSVDGNPIYYFEYLSPSAGINETYKNYYYTIQDVRSLATEQITFSFAAMSVTSVPQQLEIFCRQYFGTGGTPSNTIDTPIQPVTLTGSLQTFNITFTVPSLTGLQIGTNGDDSISMVIGYPTQMSQQIRMTNGYIKRGTADQDYPYQTYAETLAQLQSLSLPIGSDEHNTDSVTYSTTQFNGGGGYQLESNPPVGSTVEWWTETAPPGWLFVNGLPYPKSGLTSRLFAGNFGSIGYRFTNSSGWSIINKTATSFQIEADNVGVPTAPPVNTIPSLITIVSTQTGSPTVRQIYQLNFSAHLTSALIGKNLIFYTPDGPSDFIYFDDGTAPGLVELNGERLQRIYINSYVTADFITNTTLQLNNSDFLSTDNFKAIATSNTLSVISMRIGAQKSTPTIGTSGFTILVNSPGSLTDYVNLTITCVAGILLKGGDYFIISTPTVDYCYWFIVNGIGTAPVSPVTADNYIPIAITSTFSSVDVATAVTAIVNYSMFNVPDTRGLFTRGTSRAPVLTLDGNIHVDPQIAAGDRFSRPDGDQTNKYAAGTIQLDSFKSHIHKYHDVLNNARCQQESTGELTWIDKESITNSTGLIETRSINISVNKIIKI